MKKLLLFISSALCASALFANWTPLYFEPFSESDCEWTTFYVVLLNDFNYGMDTYGLMLQDIHLVPWAGNWEEDLDVRTVTYDNGRQVTRAHAAKRLCGVGLGWWGSEVFELDGIQIGLLWSRAKDMGGMQVSGLCNGSEDFGGLQIGALGNMSTSGSGLQIGGLYNEISKPTEDGSDWSVQIGLWNKNANGWQFPVINFKWPRSSAPAKVTESDPDTVKRFKRLGELHEKGILTDEEYMRKVKELK